MTQAKKFASQADLAEKKVTFSRISEQRTFLEDGDTLILRGYGEAGGFNRIGLGEASGMILAS